jgi:hypothetical protein
MRYLRGFFGFWYDFLIGDDWGIAAGVVIVLLLTALVAHRIDQYAGAAVILAGVLLTGAVALVRAAR